MRRRHLAESHDGHFRFCPAQSQLYHVVVKPPGARPAACVGPALGRGALTSQSTIPARRMEPISFRAPLALLLISLSAIAAVWWWLATPIMLARAPIDPDAKLMCVSYAPFRGAQSPLSPTTHIAPEQIAGDL